MVDTDFSLFLSKLLPLLVYPVGATLGLLLLGGLLHAFGLRKLGRASVIAAGLLLWLCSTPMVATWIYASLERQYPPKPMADIPNADVAIVLGGALGQPVPPRVSVEVTEASDRVLHAARLYKAGKVRRILVTGGNIPWLPNAVPEAELIRDLLVELDVPRTAIAIATESRNTYENALEIKALREQEPFASALLVTSAAHMPRAIAVFEHAGLPVTAASTDVQVVARPYASVLDWMPESGALDLTTQALKEWIGYAVYAWRGYLELFPPDLVHAP